MKLTIVVKLGRGVAVSKRNKIDKFRFEQLAKQIKILQQNNINVVLVVSAAVCCGEQALGLKGTYQITKQLVGGVGQALLIAQLHAIFTRHNLKIGQLLLTKHDLKNKLKRSSIAAVLNQAIEQRVVLIVNENDIIELHSFNGNDYLAEEVAELVHAQELLLLTDVDGVLDEKMQVIKTYSTDKKLAHIKKRNYKGEVGGIQAKINAALKASQKGITAWIVNGKTQDILTRLFLHQEHIGTQVGGLL